MAAKNCRPTCPVGETQCKYFEEIAALRRQNRELSQLAHTDSLTGIFNFRFMMQSLELEMERTRRTETPTVLILADLDHFKRVNDTWGHNTGNEALVQTATAIRQMVRKLDIPCRFGGEEFAVILPSTNLLVGIQVAERLRNAVQATPLLAGGKKVELTASFGVDAFSPHQSDTPEAFVKRTDQYLYLAKQGGRNRVVHAVSEHLKSGGTLTGGERDALFDLFGE